METRSLWLVRHGQASFGKADYDNLSETGHEQAYLLGQDLARRGISPTMLVSGTMKRHRQTLAEIVVGAGWNVMDDDGRDEPSPGKEPRRVRKGAPDAPEEVNDGQTPPMVRWRLDERWNELDHTAMLTAFKPLYKNMLLLKADMMRTLRPRIAFEDTFEKAVDRWTSGEHDAEYPETFPDFTSRVDAALTDVSAGPHEHVLVITSAGPVCWTTARLAAAGSLDAWKHFTLAAVNTGVTRITVDRHGTRVLTFNEFGHLDGPALVTNR